MNWQARLLIFLLSNYRKVRTSVNFPDLIESFSGRQRELAHALSAPFLGNVCLERRMISVLDLRNTESQLERREQPEGLVIEALFAICHEQQSPYWPSRIDNKVTVGEIAAAINKRQELRGDVQNFKARRIGAILSALGLRTQSLGNVGRGFTLSLSLRRQIHELARDFGFTRRDLLCLATDRDRFGGRPCDLCNEYGLTGGLELEERPPLYGNRAFRDRRRRALFDPGTGEAKEAARAVPRGPRK